MHISDGVLSPCVVGIGWAVALPTLAISVLRLRTEQAGAYGVVAAAFCAGSTIHVPVGPFSMHLVLSGIAGLLLGWGALTVVTVGLLLQALFIGLGGLTVLGVNISIMALPGAIMGVIGRQWIKQASVKKRPWIGSLIGGGTILISAILLYVTLFTTHTAFIPLAKREEIAFGPRNLGWSKQKIHETVEKWLAYFELGTVSHRPPHHLSGGEKRSVALAAAMAMEPELLILDEPANDLDQRNRRRLITYLKGLQTAIMVASHDLYLISEVTKRCVLMDNGKIVADKPTVELIHDEDTLRQYGMEAIKM